jgi:hypothetical protein
MPPLGHSINKFECFPSINVISEIEFVAFVGLFINFDNLLFTWACLTLRWFEINIS